MLRSLYISGTSMLAQQKRMDVVTNNIANIQTAGYKRDNPVMRSFSDMLVSKINDPGEQSSGEIGNLNTGVYVDQIATSFENGSLEQTSKDSDLAIQGNGFFVIETPGGERYTRDGSFLVNSEGYVVTSSGNYVLGESGRIKVGSDPFTVDSTGNVLVDGKSVGSLKIAMFADLNSLQKTGDNLFVNRSGQATKAEDFSVMQGYLEASNVNIAEEVVELMTTYRSYETNQRMIQMIDESLGKSVNEVGRV